MIRREPGTRRFRTRFLLVAVAVPFLGAWLSANATTLTNNFADRVVLTNLTGQIDGNNIGATNEPNEPRHGGKMGGSSVWISWTAPTDGIATFATDGSSFDTLLSAYYFAQTNDTTLDKLKETARNDDAGASTFTSLIQFGAHAGVTYHIAMDGFVGATGAIRLRWDFVSVTSPPPIIVSVPDDQAARQGDPVTLTVDMQTSPDIDLQWRFNGNSFGATGPTLVIPSLQPTNVGRFTLRIRMGDVRFETTPVELQINSEGQTNALARDKLLDAIESPLTPEDGGGNKVRSKGTGVSRGYNGTQIFNTTYATADPNEPLHCGFGTGATYWFAYQPPADGTLTVDTIGSSYDTFVAAYTYIPPLTSYAGLIPITCDNNSAGGTASHVEFATTKARQFFIVIGGVNGARGIAQLNYLLDTNRPPLPPLVPAMPLRQVVAVGTAATLHANALGTPPLSYTWFRGESPLPSQTNAQLSFPSVQFTDEGNYWVRVSSYLGQASNAPTLLRVVLPPRLEFLHSQNSDTLSFISRSGQIYTLECGTALTGTNWLPVGSNVLGDGSRMIFTNCAPAHATSFYRVRVE